MRIWLLRTSSKCKNSRSCRRGRDKVNPKRSPEARVSSRLRCRGSTKTVTHRFCKILRIPLLGVRMRGWVLATILKIRKIRESRKRSKNSKRIRRGFKDRKNYF